MRVALETGQYWRDVVRWNSMDNPNLLEVGQVLRVAPPAGEAQAKPIVIPAKVDAKPLGPASAPVAPASAAVPVSAAVVTTPAPTASASAPAVSSDATEEDVAWVWPAAGTVIAPFDETRNKGIDIGGKLGDPVYAAGDGRVLYADAGLRGYGNLVIIRHNNTYLSAYAHNSKLLVKEGDIVRRNQRIAEMGNSATDRMKLHFEIRRQGKAIDPSKLLPSK
jgi:lipoprotein NlpD